MYIEWDSSLSANDGYSVFKKIGARREFEKALDNSRVRAEVAMIHIQRYYTVERHAREDRPLSQR